MEVKTDILLGDEVQCIYTGVKGIALTKTVFVNGCIQFGITRKYDPKKKMEENIGEINIDSQSLKITKKGVGHKKKEPKKAEKDYGYTGGATRISKRTQ